MQDAKPAPMNDFRAVGYVTGLIVACIGAAMLIPLLVDLQAGNPNWTNFLESAIVASLLGGLVALACSNRVAGTLTIRQSFLLTTGIWAAAPLAGALPFMLGAPHVSFTDAYFEAMSGITTTGATVFVGLDGLPPGVLLWRGILQWLGGLGIVVVAMIFLPVLKVGGMQFFRTEGFDTLGKILPRALDIARGLFWVYVLLTLACIAAYAAFGMSLFDAVAHAFATVSTGGFSTSDASFGRFAGPLEYVAVFFMVASSLPFIRYVQLMNGSALPLWRDPQTRAYLRYLAYGAGAVIAYRLAVTDGAIGPVVRSSLFNVISVASGSGFRSAYVPDWGAFPLMIVFLLGFIGGCTGSSSGGSGVFRFQVLFLAIGLQIRKIHSPHRTLKLAYGNRAMEADMINPVIAFFTFYFGTMFLTAILITLTGVDAETAIFAAWTSVGNIGAAFGPGILPSFTMTEFPDMAKWFMLSAMLLGRLGILSVLVIATPGFWRD